MVANRGRFEESDMTGKLKVNSLSLKVKKDHGFVLVIALLALLVVTVIGVLAISTSTTEVMVAGNTRLREMHFAGAESGLEISDPAIRFIASNMDFGNYDAIVSDRYLAEELRSGSPFDPGDTCKNNPDLSLDLGPMSVVVDIDRMFASPCEGATIEFASGYEGTGMGGGGNICAYYRVNSRSISVIGSESTVSGFYKYISY
jgi:hypothetical protein